MASSLTILFRGIGGDDIGSGTSGYDLALVPRKNVTEASTKLQVVSSWGLQTRR